LSRDEIDEDELAVAVVGGTKEAGVAGLKGLTI